MKKLRILILAFVLLFSMPLTVFASGVGVTEAEAYRHLKEACGKGEYGTLSYGSNQYKLKEGGYLLYTQVVKDNNVNGVSFDRLTSSAKQDFLKDYIGIANAMAYDTETSGGTLENGVTTETVDELMRELQNTTGMGSQLLATLLAETKPDFATANKIYKPFSGVVGVTMGILSILTMGLLGVTMAFDIAYITIPAFQMACGGSEGTGGSGNGGKKGGVGALISTEAKMAVKKAEGGSGGGQSGDGDYKAAVGIYLKYRWKGLTLLGIAMLYLISGHIYSFVAWFIDLFSGFLGF